MTVHVRCRPGWSVSCRSQAPGCFSGRRPVPHVSLCDARGDRLLPSSPGTRGEDAVKSISDRSQIKRFGDDGVAASRASGCLLGRKCMGGDGNDHDILGEALRPFRFTKPSPNGCPLWSSPSPGVHARCQRLLSTGRRSHSVAHTETSSQRVRPTRVDTASVRSRITAGPEQESIANPAFRETRREYG